MRRAIVKNAHGFTLIEVMVAVAIIAILAAVAYPAYLDQVLRAKRAQGKTALLKAAQLQERNYLNGDPTIADPNPRPPTYLDSGKLAMLFGLAQNGVVYSGENPALNTGYYTITVDAVPNAGCPAPATAQDCFQLRATPNNAAPAGFDDLKRGVLQCGQLTLDSAGRRGIQAGAALSLTDCWDR